VLTLATAQAFHDSNLELWALRAGAGLFAGLGALALMLAAIGVYGVRAYLVEQRTREIGIRMALGATSGQVLSLVLRDGARLAGAAVAVGLPLAALVSMAFQSVFVEVGGFDPIVLATATVALGVTALLAGAVPARRASKIQPLTALRAD
jgi:ABC-type antimicrobial peptide transport system permease subunit